MPSWGLAIREWEMPMPESELFEKGLAARQDALGADYVNANLADAEDFVMSRGGGPQVSTWSAPPDERR
jgi:hypothetical protein